MKKLICLILTLAMLLACASAFAEAAEEPAESLFTPGTYTAEEQGIFAPVKVQITVSENLITGVKIDATGETPELGGLAAGKLAASIMKAQTPNVDALSGATVTSTAIIKAATAALEAAGAAQVILDRELTGEALHEKVERLLLHDKELRQMKQAAVKAGRPEAAMEIAKQAIALINTRES